MAKGSPKRRENSVAQVVSVLRDEILARNEAGWFVGLEVDVQERMKVSRPTLRQALRVLESEGLIEVRRGLNGGLFTCVPSEDAVARVASSYLDSRGATERDLLIAQEAIFKAIVSVAIQHPDRESMREWFRDCDAQGEYTPRRALETCLEAMNRLAALANNELLILFERVLFQLAKDHYDIGIFRNPERMEVTLSYLRDLADALADGDSDRAIAVVGRNSAMIDDWVREFEKKNKHSGKKEVE